MLLRTCRLYKLLPDVFVYLNIIYCILTYLSLIRLVVGHSTRDGSVTQRREAELSRSSGNVSIYTRPTVYLFSLFSEAFFVVVVFGLEIR